MPVMKTGFLKIPFWIPNKLNMVTIHCPLRPKRVMWLITENDASRKHIIYCKVNRMCKCCPNDKCIYVLYT